ncbi:hypothetical protein ACFPIJ_56475 [Dactylosporangium cerinum]|uniref:MarR family transcriptional regulator n=1 Tax=Dactylosporangium cerinum TaxID=1434730 RepID=A0ABV9WG03_9ACTN
MSSATSTDRAASGAPNTDGPAAERELPVLDDRSQQLLVALTGLGQATAAALAVEAGMPYSTATPKLRKLNSLGLAESIKADNGQTVWQLTDAGRQHPAVGDADQADAGDQHDVSGPSEADAVPQPAADIAAQPTGDSTSGTPADAAAVDDGDPDETVTAEEPADPADAETDGGDTPDEPADTHDPADADTAAQTSDDAVARTESSDDAGHHPADEPMEPQPGDASVEAVSAAADEPDPTAASAGTNTTVGEDSPATGAKPKRTQANRRAPGSLDRTTLTILAAHPDEVFTVGRLSKLIDAAEAGTGVAKASPGAVVLAGQRLVGRSEAILASEKPVGFQFRATAVTAATVPTAAAPTVGGDAQNA